VRRQPVFKGEPCEDDQTDTIAERGRPLSKQAHSRRCARDLRPLHRTQRRLADVEQLLIDAASMPTLGDLPGSSVAGRCLDSPPTARGRPDDSVAMQGGVRVQLRRPSPRSQVAETIAKLDAAIDMGTP